MEFGVLGPLEVRVEGNTVALGGAKQRALLAVLLLHAGEVVSAERLVDELWGEEPPASAAHTVQVFVSRLRKALSEAGAERQPLETRAPGYALRLEPGELDLHRFEAQIRAGRERLETGDARAAAGAFREALALWRGPPLADFAYERFAQTAIARLEEMRVAALADRIKADLVLGRHHELVGEIEELVAEHPLHERFYGQLMLALYRCGRQAEALEAYQQARRTLVDELGIDPSPTLHRLERRILVHDPELDLARAAPFAVSQPTREPPDRSILVVPWHGAALEPLASLGQALAASLQPHELLVFRLVPPGSPVEVSRATAELLELRGNLVARGIHARAAAFSSGRPGEDALRLAADEKVDLLLAELPDDALGDGPFADDVGQVLADAPCDVVLLRGGPVETQGPVVVPFGGFEHDWGALELGAWAAAALGVPLRVLGSTEDDENRDASRLLAAVSMAIQRTVGIGIEPHLVPPGSDSVLNESRSASLLCLGLGERWRQEGLGATRRAIVASAQVPVAVVKHGARPSGLAPREGSTRYRWSMAGAMPPR
jgi:DNA-binding SARP family transcriptional activator